MQAWAGKLCRVHVARTPTAQCSACTVDACTEYRHEDVLIYMAIIAAKARVRTFLAREFESQGSAARAGNALTRWMSVHYNH